MIAICIIKKDRNIGEAESQIASATKDIPELRISTLKNIGAIFVDYPESVSFEEIKRRIISCDSIRADAICQDYKLHLIQ